MQKICIIGSLGSNAQVKQSNGSEFITFDICDNYRFTRKSDGMKIEKQTWYSCILNSNRKGVLPFLTKGTMVYVDGRLDSRVYQSSDGTYKVSLNVSVDSLEFCGVSKDFHANDSGDGPF